MTNIEEVVEMDEVGSMSHSDYVDTPDTDLSASAKGFRDLEVAKTEDRWVWRLRLLTTIVLLGVAFAICLIVYLEGRQSETNAFEQAFDDLGEKMVTSFEDVVEQRFGIIAAFTDTITADANGVGTGPFPYVTPPFFAQRAEDVAVLAKLMFIYFFPQVHRDEVDEWSRYSIEHQGWKAEGVAQELGLPLEEVEPHAKPIFDTIIDIHNPGGPVPAVNTSDGPYYPSWCFYPAHNDSYANWDWGSDQEHHDPIARTLSSGKPMFEKAYDYFGFPDKEEDPRYRVFQRNKHGKYLDDPQYLAFFPVFDSFDRQNRQVSALLLVVIYWRTYFDDLLPPGADGIVVILENDCEQQYTYRVDGQHSAFVGHGDSHDQDYDYLEAGTSIDSVIQREGSQAEHDTAATCHYRIRVYPSREFEDQHRTNKPWIYVMVLASLFLFTSAVFLLYDYVVEQRQRVVLKSAQQSGTLVNSLFPGEVRDRLYQEQVQQEQQQQHHQHNMWKISANKEPNIKAADFNCDSRDLPSCNMTVENKKAIATLYPETTIFFADICGFTKWSAKRTPVEVFQLLETLYGAFDTVALRRKVFKVETIGDCYVAATGLPEPQEDHVVIMAKFASDCLAKMKVLTVSLKDSLGEDTADLAMRVGMHSGPVTAGVLRGQKSRFQLFGDTVNTAARIESNGVPNRIHASEQTADALKARGKQGWLTIRDKKITAKGLGELVTYFVDPTISGSKSSASGRISSSSEPSALWTSPPEPSLVEE